MAKAVRLSDIAEKMGVSTVTVSKALSDQKGVSEDMRAKIKALAEEMGYVVPAGSKGIRSFNIGVVISENYLYKYDTFYWDMYQKVATRAMNTSCFTILEVIHQINEENMEMPKVLLEGKVDGIIVIGSLTEKYLSMLVAESDVPVIFMDFTDENLKIDSVVSDSYYGAYHMTNYLIKRGHTKIAYVGTLCATNSITDRYYGFSKAMLENGLEVKKEWQIDDRKLGSVIIDESVMKLPKDMPTAFFCNCDLTAGALIKKLEEKGYSIPNDVSVIGYDNYIYPGSCDVEITTYEVDLTEMAKKAVNMIIKKINKPDYVYGIQIVSGRLVEKGSVKDNK